MPITGFVSGSLGIAVPGVTTPVTIFGAALVAWFTADVGVHNAGGTTPPSNNDLVSQWDDQSGNGRNIGQSTGANQPTFLAAGFNGLPALTFSGTASSYLQSQATNFSMGTDGGGTLFAAVIMTTGTANFGRAVAIEINSATADFNDATNACWCLRDASNNGVASYRDGIGEEGILAVSLNTPLRFASVYDKANLTNWLNNTTSSQSVDTQSFTSANGQIIVGTAFNSGFNFSGGFWEGQISEIIVVNRAATTPELASMDTYIKGHWGL